MDSSSEIREQENTLSASERTHIADIDHSRFGNTAGHIEANVVLVWPYSSHTKELSLLLAERDVVLRKAKGQVKVTFRSTCAREVAKLRIGIGETIKLSLNDAELVEEIDQFSTPGKKAGFTLHYSRAVEIQVNDNADRSRYVHFVPPPNKSSVQNGRVVAFGTPLADRIADISLTELAKGPHSTLKTGFRLSSNSFPGSFTDPFAADDGSVPGRGRKRTKFGRHSGAWKFADDDDDDEEVVSVPKNGVQHDTQKRSPMRVIDLTEDKTPPAIYDTTVSSPSEAGVASSLQEFRNEMEVAQSTLINEVERNRTSAILVDQPLMPTLPSDQNGNVWPPTSPPQLAETPFLDASEMSTSRLDIFPSSHPTIDSPLASRSQYIPTFGNQLPELDPSIRPEFQSEPFPTTAAEHDMIAPSQPLLREDLRSIEASISTDALAEAEVDLDALQRHIELDSITVPHVESSQEVTEVKDAMKSRLDQGNFPDIEVLEQLHYQGSEILPPEPISSQVFSQIDGSVRLPEPTNEVSIVPGPRPNDLTLQETAAPLGVADGDESTGRRLFSQQSISPSYILEKPEPTGVETYNLLSSLEDHSMTPRFLDGTTDTIRSSVPSNAAVPQSTAQLPLSDEMEIASPSKSIVHHEEQSSKQIAMENANVTRDDRTQMEPAGNVTHNLPTPLATQVDVSTQEGATRLRDKVPGLPLTPIDSQDPLPAEHSELTDNVGEETGLPSQTVRKAPAHRFSQRLNDELRMSEGVYSDYFTPRKSVILPKPGSSSKPLIGTPSQPQEQIYSSILQRTDEAEEDFAVVAQSPSNNLIDFLDAAQAMSDSRQGMPTDLAYYVSLKSLHEHYNQLVDVLAVCTADSTIPERANPGPKDFYTTIHLTDTSLDHESSTSITAQIFRPWKRAIPSVYRGDVVLLRNFKIQSQSRSPLLLSCDESAWAVFEVRGILSTQTGSLSASVSGPPLEYGAGEQQLVRTLSQWWTEVGQSHYPVLTYDEREPRQDTTNGRVLRRRVVLPPPLDIRKSPRSTQRDHSIDSVTDVNIHDLQSPSQDHVSPAFSSETGRASMPPPSASVVSPTSPVSVMTTRSSRSTSLATAPKSTRKGKTRVSKRLPNPNSDEALTQQPTPNRPRTRSSTKDLSVLTSPAQSQSQPQGFTHLHSSPTSDTPLRDLFTMEGTTAIHAEGASDSAKTHRRSRRSASLIHELRDGTQWIDVEEKAYSGDTDSDSQQGRRTSHQAAVVEDEVYGNDNVGAGAPKGNKEVINTDFGIFNNDVDNAAVDSQAVADQHNQEGGDAQEGKTEIESAPTAQSKRLRGCPSSPNQSEQQMRGRPRRNAGHKGGEATTKSQETQAERETQTKQRTAQIKQETEPHKDEIGFGDAVGVNAENVRITRSKGKPSASQATVNMDKTGDH